MDFGHLQNVDNVDFSLPPLHTFTGQTLKGQKRSKNLEVYIGLPVWSVKEYKGKIYPQKAKPGDFLHYYSRAFNCIELNSTFYAIPGEKLVKGWAQKVPADFRFCPKLPRDISQKPGRSSVELDLKRFLKVIEHFGDHLGTIFMQLPYNYSSKQREELEKFIGLVPDGFRFGIEFRDASWFKDNTLQGILKVMQERDFSSVMCDLAGRRDVLHLALSNKTLFVRMLGNALHRTDYERVDEWISLSAQLIDSGLELIEFFIHQHEEHLGIDLAANMIEKINKRLGLSLALPAIESADLFT